MYKAIQAPDGFIPLHSHPEVEWLYVLEGVLQVLAYRDADSYWLDVNAGESVVIPSRARQALRTKRTPLSVSPSNVRRAETQCCPIKEKSRNAL